MRTPRLPVVDWTAVSADLSGLVRFAERRNLVSARVPSHFRHSLSAFKRSWCNHDTEQYLTAVKDRGRLSVNKRVPWSLMWRQQLWRSQNDVVVNEQDLGEHLKRLAALWNLDAYVVIIMARGSIWENATVSAKERVDNYVLKEYKPRIEEDCLKLLYQTL